MTGQADIGSAVGNLELLEDNRSMGGRVMLTQSGTVKGPIKVVTLSSVVTYKANLIRGGNVMLPEGNIAAILLGYSNISSVMFNNGSGGAK